LSALALPARRPILLAAAPLKKVLEVGPGLAFAADVYYPAREA
jgi:hypothetical protein